MIARVVSLLIAVMLLMGAASAGKSEAQISSELVPAHHAQYTPTYYVGQNQCDDAGPGTRDTPFCTVQTGLDALEAGEVLLILNGVYHERVYLMNSGTASAPIVILGESQDAIIDAGCPDYPCDEAIILAGEEFIMEGEDEPLYAGFFMGWNEHVIIDGFTIRNAPVHAVELVETTGITVQNMRVQNAALSLVNVYDSHGFKLLNNDLNGGNLGRKTPEGVTIHLTHEEAITIVNTDNFELANNHLYDGFKEGFTIKVGSNNGTVHHNKIERHCAVGIYLDEAHDVQVFGNTISDIGFITNTRSDIGPRAPDMQRCDEVLTGSLVFQPDWDADPTDPAYQQDGIGYEPGTGIMLSVGDLDAELVTGKLANISIYQNIIRDINVGCMGLWDEMRESGYGTGTLTNVHIYNNVLYNCARSREEWGPGIFIDESAVDTHIYNNIVALASETIIDAGATGSNISNNLFFQTSGPIGAHYLIGDPLFVNPDAGDFRLQSGSPAIDAGLDTGLAFEGAAPDIGAFEFKP